ncbi:MAG: molybdenum cofactor biosynthesis protein MoaE [Pseudomonadota bacterium]
MIEVQKTPFNLDTELSRFNETHTEAGAIVSFVGLVREKSGEALVQELMLEHYPGRTEESIARIDQRARDRWPGTETLIIHRVGKLQPGDPIVLVCAASAHRRAAFSAVEFIMDFLKTEALFWKKEVRSDGEHWIEPRRSDYDDANHWIERELCTE